MRIFSQLLFLSLLCCACQSNSSLSLTQYQESKISQQKPPFEVALPKELNTNKIDEIIENISFIPLETTPDCLIAAISDIKADEDTLFIADFRQVKQILVYDMSGNYLHRISSLGAGPQEYINLSDIQIDTIKNHIYLLDGDQGKILVYDYMGNYQETILLPFKFVNHFLLGKNGIIYLEFGFRPNDCISPTNIVAYNTKKKKIIQSFFPYDNSLFKLRLKKNVFTTGSENDYVWETLGNTVYRIESDSLYPLYRIAEKPYPFDFYGLTYREIKEKCKNQNYTTLSNFFDLDDWYYARIDQHNLSIHNFINKSNNISIFDISYLIDLHQKEVLLPEIFKLSGNQICSWIEAGMCKRIMMTPEKLKKLPEDNNPILVIYQMKHP